jgi:outer membrane protein assembly factor BamD
MINYNENKHGWWKNARRSALALFLSLIMVLMGCAGGIPSIPDSPESIIEKGNSYFERGKYFQSSELFKAFLLRHPGHARSDYAQFMLAESYFNDEDYALAGVEYQLLVTNYGYSDYVDDGYFREAVSLYRQSPKASLDQSRCYDALGKFDRFVMVFNQSPLVPEAQKYVKEIKDKLAKKDYENAAFYFSRKRYDSSLIYLNKVVENYPDNEYYALSLFLKGRIKEIKGEIDEAKRLYQQVIDYPADIEVKKEATEALQKIEAGA